MYRRGIVLQVDEATARAKVTFPDKQNVESPWLEVLQVNTLTTKDQALPDVGELVACLMGERDETGCVIGALYAGDNKPELASVDIRRTMFPNGGLVEFDRGSKSLTVVATNVGLNASVKVGNGLSAVALATKVSSALAVLKAAISGAATTGGDGGASFKTSLVAALAAWPTDLASTKLTSD